MSIDDRPVAPLSRGSVLIVDDDGDLRSLARHLLERAGYEVHEAQNAAATLGHVNRHPTDVVVLDHDLLEGMDGLELAAALSASHPGVRILMFSAYLSDAGRFAGVDAVLDKMDSDQLVAALPPLRATARSPSSRSTTTGNVELEVLHGAVESHLDLLARS